MNLSFLGLGIGLAIVGVIGVSSGRPRSKTSNPDGKKAAGSPIGTFGMFFLGLGIVLCIIGL